MNSRVDDQRPARGLRRSRTTGRVRIEDVARVANLSSQTVSRYFRTPAAVAASTRDAIREAVRATGYIPNMIAGSLASNRSRVVAIIVPTIANPIHAAPVDSLSAIMRHAGYQVLLGHSGYDVDVEDEIIAAFLRRRVEGLILTGISVSPHSRRMIEAAAVPVVQIWELPEDPIDMAVGFSNYGAGAAVAEHLAARGYHHPAIIAHGAPMDTRSSARVEGFTVSAARLGLSAPAIHVVPQTSVVCGAAMVDEVLSRPNSIDAVFAVSDQVAIGFLLGCQARGIPVPDTVGIVGFGDVETGACLTPALTTIRVHRKELGEVAGKLLLRRFGGEPAEKHVVDIGFKLVVRDSTPARTAEQNLEGPEQGGSDHRRPASSRRDARRS